MNISCPFSIKLADICASNIGSSTNRTGSWFFVYQPIISTKEQIQISELKIFPHQKTNWVYIPHIKQSVILVFSKVFYLRYTWCFRINRPYFRSTFLGLIYMDITKTTWTVTRKFDSTRSFIHSFSILSDDRSKASSKTMPPHRAN